jgi:hypothetical protein
VLGRRTALVSGQGLSDSVWTRNMSKQSDATPPTIAAAARLGTDEELIPT